MSDSEFLARVKIRMDELGIKQAEMARLLELPSQSAFSNLLTGKRALKFSEALDIERVLHMPRDDAARVVPVIGIASASSWNEAIAMPIGQMPIPPRSAGKRAFAVEVKGDSLNRIIPDGAWVVIDPEDRHLYVGKCYLIENDEHDVTVKCYKADPARFEPMSTNETHKTIFAGDGVKVIGRVCWTGSPL